MVANEGETERVDVVSTFHSMILYWALCCYTSYVTIYLDLDCLAPFQNYRCRHSCSRPCVPTLAFSSKTYKRKSEDRGVQGASIPFSSKGEILKPGRKFGIQCKGSNLLRGLPYFLNGSDGNNGRIHHNGTVW